MVQERGRRERCSSWTVLRAQDTGALCSGFSLSQGNAEALDRWGGKTKHHLISGFRSNTSASNYRNRIVYVKISASQKWDVFWDTVYIFLYRYRRSGQVLYDFYGSGQGPIWMDDVACTGSENSLTDCLHTPSSENNCDHGEDISIECDSMTTAAPANCKYTRTVQVIQSECPTNWGFHRRCLIQKAQTVDVDQ